MSDVSDKKETAHHTVDCSYTLLNDREIFDQIKPERQRNKKRITVVTRNGVSIFIHTGFNKMVGEA